jgi:hypothetical protein
VIPVRVPADTPLHIVRSGVVIGADHPLAGAACPVDDEPLGSRPCSLVYVGTHPSDRARGGAFWTGAAIAVHDDCALADGGVISHGEAVRQPACDPGHVLDDVGDLALALGGSETSFTAELLRLVGKADAGNRRRLALAYPRLVRAYELREAAAPLPAGVLLPALDDPGGSGRGELSGTESGRPA